MVYKSYEKQQNINNFKASLIKNNMGNKPQIWAQFSKSYDDKIYSLTKTPKHREQVTRNIAPGETLNIGTGSTPYMNHHLIDGGHNVVATDFCEEMLSEARSQFTHPRLRYILADTKNLPFKNNSFDNVISMNSILPQEREDIIPMFYNIHRVLKKGGIFTAFLPSFDCGEGLSKEWGLTLDKENLREHDTTGWQCFHTPESINGELGSLEWETLRIEKIFLDEPEDIEQLKNIYHVDTSKTPIYEYLITARK
jgi:ubiquinone/menaquinone biosynthesis C-methylase UbiE